MAEFHLCPLKFVVSELTPKAFICFNFYIFLWFSFEFLWWLVILSKFSHICGPCVYLPWKNVYSGHGPLFKIKIFVFLLLISIRSLYILRILLRMWLTNIFSYSVVCFSFYWWRNFLSDVVRLAYFCFSCDFNIITKIIAKTDSEQLSPSWKFYSFSSYTEVFNPRWVDFLHWWCKIRTQCQGLVV